MILSRKHQFIFLRNPKAAGSSVTVSLSRYLGPWDIQIGAHDGILEDGIGPNLYSYARVLHPRVGCGLLFMSRFLAKNFKHKTPASIAYRKAFTQTVKASWRHTLGRLPMHPDAKNVKTRFEKEWKDYLKFCIMRNPWDRVVSLYHYNFRYNLGAKSNVPSFSEWVDAAFTRQDHSYRVPDSRKIYRIDGELAVDYVIKYENLSNELQVICQRVGLDWDGWLPNKKGNIRKNKDYRGFYDDNTRKVIGDFYRQDIEEFGYKF